MNGSCEGIHQSSTPVRSLLLFDPYPSLTPGGVIFCFGILFYPYQAPPGGGIPLRGIVPKGRYKVHKQSAAISLSLQERGKG
ncbi:MAG: hypothetical protein AMXMBFR49_24030 [Chlorobiota bacterium]